MSKVRLLRVRLLEVRELSVGSTRIVGSTMLFSWQYDMICWQYDNYSQKILTVSLWGNIKGIFSFLYIYSSYLLYLYYRCAN